ncbi:VWA domain-containing protein [Mangrovicoccus algicola]|uniref:VWA domain-containing protein n=1 Tax=Mangrovicoccus algicola TaxID=2771008 RepID=A0A8J6Z199_9RHOB|nr:VWA domain-containing protein [Mangrovicoccus algicola]MBE3639681.1 VWA domain-containing protein [Mangrovicoccus algicola]
MITLAAPWALLLLPLPVIVHRLAPPRRERVPALRFPFFRRLVAAAGAEAREGAVVLTRGRVQMAAAILAWALLVLALAGPERLGRPVTLESAARDMVLAIDISGSMDTRDMARNNSDPLRRLDAVKEVVTQFVADRDGDRVGLIVFGTKAYLQAPLTEDLDTVTALLARTETGMAGPHTALGDAIGLAIRTFEGSQIEDRLLILLSDGSDTASRMDPVNAAAIAGARGVQIVTIGVGDPEGSGEDRVDLAALQDIAARSGGAYYFADDRDALEQIYDRIDALTPRETETRTWRPRTDLSWIPMGLAALIILGATLWLQLRRTGGPA